MARIPSSKLGQLYLGADFDLSTNSLQESPVYYDSRDLVTHGVCIGMTGSGKTGLCIGLLEECVRNQIPVLAIDPKGDLTNLKLVFPDFSPSHFRPWISEDSARRKNISPDDFATQQASLWEKGLGDWGIDSAHMQKFRASTDVTIFTPGSTAGTPVNILHSLDAPDPEELKDLELLRERIAGITTSILGLANLPSDPHAPAHLLIASILESRWMNQQQTTFVELISLIQSPPVTQLGAFSVDEFFPPADRRKLAMQLNGIAASPSFQTWLQGVPLDIPSLLYTPEGKPRISVFYIAHLQDAERMFFASLLLNQFIGWMRRQPGTQSLRCLVYFDEIFGYLPPHPANPATKRLLMTILKQGRAFGAGTLLVTQNPVDLDYKALSNCGTWFIGKLQTDQDKARILDGLQGAIQSSGTSWDRQSADKTLSQLGNRVFLLHNVHTDHPTVIHSRWAMSYLPGPLTRPQIEKLQPDITASFASPTSPTSPTSPALSRIAPPLPKGLDQAFLIQNTGSDSLLTPILFATATITYRYNNASISQSLSLLLNPEHITSIQSNWDQAETHSSPLQFLPSPPPNAQFSPLPDNLQSLPVLQNAKNTLIPHLIHTQTLEVYENTHFKLKSLPNESKEDFLERVRDIGEIQLEAESTKLKERAEKTIQSIQKKLEKEDLELKRDREILAARKRDSTMRTISKIGSIIGSFLSKRKSSFSQAGSLARSFTSGASTLERAEYEVVESEEEIARLQAQHDKLLEKLETDLNSLAQQIDAKEEDIKVVPLTPAKSNIRITNFGVCWTI